MPAPTRSPASLFAMTRLQSPSWRLSERSPASTWDSAIVLVPSRCRWRSSRPSAGLRPTLLRSRSRRHRRRPWRSARRLPRPPMQRVWCTGTGTPGIRPAGPLGRYPGVRVSRPGYGIPSPAGAAATHLPSARTRGAGVKKAGSGVLRPVSRVPAKRLRPVAMRPPVRALPAPRAERQRRVARALAASRRRHGISGGSAFAPPGRPRVIRVAVIPAAPSPADGIPAFVPRGRRCRRRYWSAPRSGCATSNRPWCSMGGPRRWPPISPGIERQPRASASCGKIGARTSPGLWGWTKPRGR